MPCGRRIRIAAVTGTVAWALLALGAPPAAAAPGTWGAGRYPYADGTVCSTGGMTAPLAAWTVSGSQRAYLVREVMSAGPIDSAAPPVPSAGRPNPAADVGPGAGFAGDQDIAAVAYLLSQGQQTASVTAAAVLTQTDPGGVPACADRGAAAAALAAARDHAGPYTVTVTAGSAKARPGQPAPITAVVHTSAGRPVSGARVSFTAGQADMQPAAAVTDDTGTAHASVVVHSGTTPSVTVTAATEVATGLRQATITATPSATNPTGGSVPAVYPAPPTRFAGQADVGVDQSAHPQVSTALGSQLVQAAKPFTARADVSGLNGHTANVSFDLLGPRPLADRTLCASLSPAGWTGGNLPVAATTSATVKADGPAQGGSLTPTSPGCYALRVRVATVDATPPATRTAPLSVVAALDTTAVSPDRSPAVFASQSSGQQLTGAVEMSHGYGLNSGVDLSVTGPIRPPDGNCGPDAKAWHSAPRNTVSAAVDAGPGGAGGTTAFRYSAPAPSGVGCYRVEPKLVLSTAGNQLRVPTGNGRAAYVLDPTVTAAVQRTWSVTPAPVPVQVDVDGLYGLAAHVRTAMYRTASDPDGCSRASFTGTRQTALGPATTVPPRPGIVTVSLRSGPTPRVGCYAVVPELTVDGAPQVHVAGHVDATQATLIAGVNPNPHIRRVAVERRTDTGVGLPVALAALAAALVAVMARIALVAYRHRDDPGDGGILLERRGSRLRSGP